jgi:hypothetical protein
VLIAGNESMTAGCAKATVAASTTHAKATHHVPVPTTDLLSNRSVTRVGPIAAALPRSEV